MKQLMIAKFIEMNRLNFFITFHPKIFDRQNLDGKTLIAKFAL